MLISTSKLRALAQRRGATKYTMNVYSENDVEFVATNANMLNNLWILRF